MRIVPWSDPIIDKMKIDARSLYVESFWLGVLGPSATWVLRRFADLLEEEPGGVDVDLHELEGSLGIGSATSRHTPVTRAIGRCVRFGLARPLGINELAVRRFVAPVPRRHLSRLPSALQVRHAQWENDYAREPGPWLLRRRARLIALELRSLGVDRSGIERHLLRRSLHPSIAFDSARWAWSNEDPETVAGPESD